MMMSYEETLRFLYAQLPVFEREGAAAYKPGLATMRRMDDYFSHPHCRYKTLHVAGTNGKGSVSHTLAAILQAAGYRVGLYTSPHLLDFAERIRVNGRPVAHEYVRQWVAEHYEAVAACRPTFFELATMMAFCYFAAERVDVAVVEVGLGGRLDSTNIITPVASIITNISFDHMQQLGNTLAEIAAEKAGIMKTGVPCVVGECGTDDPLRAVFDRCARAVGTSVRYATDVPEVTSVVEDEGTLRYATRSHGSIVGALAGTCQPANTATILAALPLLSAHFDIAESAVAEGFRRVTEMTGLMGRWQRLSTLPLVYCDTGHNEGCFRYIVGQLRRFLDEGRTAHVVMGMMSDKDVEAVVRQLPAEAVYYATAAQTPRALPAAALQSRMAARGLRATAFATVREAVAAARHAVVTASREVIFIGGSGMVVAEALPLFPIAERPSSSQP